MLCGTLFAMVSVFSQSIAPALVFILLFFIPGYFLAGVFFSGNVERAIISFPVSIIPTSFILMLMSLFLEASTIAVPTIIISVFYIFVFLIFRKFPKIRLVEFIDRKSELIAYFVLFLVVVLAFFVHLSYVSKGSFNHDYPVGVTSIDKSIQLATLQWMSESDTITMNPAFHFGEKGLKPMAQKGYGQGYTPISMFPVAAFTRLSGMSFWNGQNLFSCLIFVFTVLSIFLLAFYLFGEKIALLSGLLAAVPGKYFLDADAGGHMRVVLGILFAALSLIFLLKSMKKEKYSGLLSGIFIAGLVISHLSDWPLVFVPIILVFGGLFFSKEKLEYFRFAFPIFLIPALVLGFYFLSMGVNNSTGIFANDFNLSGKILISPGEFEKNPFFIWAANVKLSDILLPFAVSFASSFFILFRHFSANRNFKFQSREIFIFTALPVFVFTIGITEVYVQYISKIRYSIILIFFAPLVAFFCWNLANKFIKDLNRSFVVCFLVLLVILNPFVYQPNFFDEKLSPDEYDSLVWVSNNSNPSETVLPLVGFWQNSQVFGNRTGTTNPSDDRFYNYLKGAELKMSLSCFDGAIKYLPNLEVKNCPVKKNLEPAEFDYLLVNYWHILHFKVDFNCVEEKLADKGFVRVATFGKVAVYKNNRAPRSEPSKCTLELDY